MYLISLGLGSPASIAVMVTFGLAPSALAAPVKLTLHPRATTFSPLSRSASLSLRERVTTLTVKDRAQ